MEEQEISRDFAFSLGYSDNICVWVVMKYVAFLYIKMSAVV